MRTKILMIMTALLLIGIIGCSAPQALSHKKDINAKYNYEISDANLYELTEYDILEMLSKREIKSTNVVVKGVKLGDRYMDVQKKLGLPDYVEDYYDGITNLKYEKDGKTYMIVHLEDNTVTRIVIKEGMDPELKGKSKLGIDLDMVTMLLGKPTGGFADSKYIRTYYYEPRGLEVYLKTKKMIGYGFVPPEIHDKI